MGFIFQPQFGSNQSVTASGTSDSVAIDPRSNVVYLHNTDSANIAYIRFGTGAQTATAADFPLLPGIPVTLRKGDSVDTLAYISASGAAIQIMTGTIYTG
jgi:hypothetical protein